MKHWMFLLWLPIVFIAVQCQKNSTAISVETTYTPLSVGDEWQMVSTTDSSTFQFKVVKTRTRMDGQKVFVIVPSVGQWPADTLYFFLKEGYLIHTNFFPYKQIGIPAYLEFRLAKSHPQQGERWDVQIGDTSKYFTASNYGHFTLSCAWLQDVFQFKAVFPIASWPLPVLFYAPGLGHIATGYSKAGVGFDIQYVCTYRKVGGKTYGALLPPQNPPLEPDKEKRNLLIKRVLGLF